MRPGIEKLTFIVNIPTCPQLRCCRKKESGGIKEIKLVNKQDLL